MKNAFSVFQEDYFFLSFCLSHRRFLSDLHHENQSGQKSQAFFLHTLLLPHGLSPLSETPVSHMMDAFTMPHVSCVPLCISYHFVSHTSVWIFFLTYFDSFFLF